MSDSVSGWYDFLVRVLTIGIAAQRKGFVWTNGTTVRRAPGSMKRPSVERPPLDCEVLPLGAGILGVSSAIEPKS